IPFEAVAVSANAPSQIKYSSVSYIVFPVCGQQTRRRDLGLQPCLEGFLVELARQAQGKFGLEMDGARDLEVGQGLLGISDEVFLRNAGAVANDHEGDWNLAENPVGAAYDGNVLDRRMRRQDRLDFGRRDIGTAPYDDILDPSRQVEMPVAVAAAE